MEFALGLAMLLMALNTTSETTNTAESTAVSVAVEVARPAPCQCVRFGVALLCRRTAFAQR